MLKRIISVSVNSLMLVLLLGLVTLPSISIGLFSFKKNLNVLSTKDFKPNPDRYTEKTFEVPATLEIVSKPYVTTQATESSETE